jgi:hypothetical protein
MWQVASWGSSTARVARGKLARAPAACCAAQAYPPLCHLRTAPLYMNDWCVLGLGGLSHVLHRGLHAHTLLPVELPHSIMCRRCGRDLLICWPSVLLLDSQQWLLNHCVLGTCAAIHAAKRGSLSFELLGWWRCCWAGMSSILQELQQSVSCLFKLQCGQVAGAAVCYTPGVLLSALC